ncbi:MAG: hypothetical protein ILP02_03335 [Clostridia bacterium]|nr:hypothetical protein [Clostridia bacterium]
MRTAKKLIALIAVISIAAIVASCGDTPEPKTVLKGTFTSDQVFLGVTEENFTYSDDYFKKSGKADNNALMTMSYCLSMSTFEFFDCTYVTKLYSDIGFIDVVAEDMLGQPTDASIGSAIAHKKIDGKNVVAVAIRGERYKREWASNAIVGKSGNAKGFDDASVKIAERLKNYIERFSLKDNKIWMVGYSRAGAVADLTGAYINDHLDEFSCASDDVYVYAFESPAACADDAVYDNIHVVLNKNDPIPYLYPASWGLHHCGRVVYIGTDQKVDAYVGLFTTKAYGTARLDEVLAETFKLLGESVSREEYADTLEQPLTLLHEEVYSKSDDENAKLLAFFKDLIDSVTNDVFKQMRLIMPISSIFVHESDALYMRLAEVLIGFVEDARSTYETAAALTDEDFLIIENSIYPILRAFGPVLVDDSYFNRELSAEKYYEAFLPDYTSDDFTFGSKYGKETGSVRGYRDGFMKRPFSDTPDGAEEKYGKTYVDAYNEAYIAAYASSYALGAAHADDLIAKAAYDGEKTGGNAGFSDGRKGAEKRPYDDRFYYENWMTPEYVDAYDAAYAKAYERRYDEGVNDDTPVIEEPYILECYHIMTIASNIEAIISNHYSQTNLLLIRARNFTS